MFEDLVGRDPIAGWRQMAIVGERLDIQTIEHRGQIEEVVSLGRSIFGELFRDQRIQRLVRVEFHAPKARAQNQRFWRLSHQSCCEPTSLPCPVA